MIVFNDKRRTPKEAAAFLIARCIAELPEDLDWKRGPGLKDCTPAEREAIVEQVGKLKARCWRLLNYDGDAQPLQDLRDASEARIRGARRTA